MDTRTLERDAADMEASLEDASKQSAAIAMSALLKELESQYTAKSLANDKLQLQLQDERSKFAELNRKLVNQDTMEGKIAALEQETNFMLSKLNSLTDESQLKQEILDKKQLEIDSLREELSSQASLNATLKQQFANYELQSKLTESEALPLFHEKERLKTELMSLQAHNNWLDQELSSKSKQYQHLQRDSRDRTIQLQMQLDQTIREKDALAARLTALENIERKLLDNVNQLTTETSNYKQELGALQETFDVENREHNRIISLQKEQISQWSQRYDDLVKENENLKSQANQSIEIFEKESKKELAAMQEKYTAMLQEQSERFEKQRREIISQSALPALMENAVPVDGGSDDMEPQSISDIFQELEEVKASLYREQLERKTWQKQFQLVQQDIKEQAPRIIRQRQEYEMAVDQLSDYQQRLELALVECSNAERDAADARKMVEVLQNRLAEKNEDIEQLNQQVQVLLVNRAISSGDYSDPEGIAGSIQEMQNQNQHLLSENRRLTRTVEELRNKLKSDDTKEQLDKAAKELKSLLKDREEQEILVERIVQQRDLYRALLAEQDSSILESESGELSAVEMAKMYSERLKKMEVRNKELEEEIASCRTEHKQAMDEKNEITSRLNRYELHSDELTKSLEKSERDLLTARSNEARLESEAKYHRDHCSRLESSLERARNEVAQVNSAKNELQRINADMQQVLSNNSAGCALLEGEKRRLEGSIRLLQIQVESSKSCEQRMLEENNQLRSEVARQSTSVNALQRIEACLQATKEGENEALRQENESLKQKMTDASFQFKVDIEELNARNAQLEDSIAKLEVSKESLVQETQNLKQKLVAAEIEIEVLRKQNAPQETHPREADNTLVGNLAELESLQSEIAALRAENETLNRSIANSRDSAAESEKSLTELQHAVDRMNTEKSSDMETLKNQLQSLKRTLAAKDEVIRDLTDDLAKQTGERTRAVDELKGTILSLETTVKNHKTDMESAKTAEASLTHDLKRLREEIQIANANFERELALHSQARTALRSTSEALDKETNQRKAAEAMLDETTKELKEQVQAISENLISKNAEIELLEKRLNDAHEHNATLHDQLQVLSNTVENNQLARFATASVTESGDENMKKIENGLRETVKYLQSENNILKIEIDAAKRLAERERALSNSLRRNLEETQAELKSLQSDSSVGLNQSATIAANDYDAKFHAGEEQLVLLRDSNKLLREELGKLEHSCSSLQAELDATKLLVEPAKDIQLKLESSIKSLLTEKESLEAELQSWKDRVRNLVSKFHQIDPDEHKRLESEVEELRKEKESFSAWKTATEEESNRIRTIAKTLNQKIKEQKLLFDSQQKDLEQLTAEKAAWTSISSSNAVASRELTEVKEKLSKLTANVESKDRELEGANTRNDKLREKLREFHSIIRDLRAEVRKLKGPQPSVTNQESSKDSSSLPPPNDQISKTVLDEAPGPTEIQKPNRAPENENAPSATSALANPIPSIPHGGFKFRQSDSTRSQLNDNQITASSHPPSIALPTPPIASELPEKGLHPSPLEASRVANVSLEPCNEGSAPSSLEQPSGAIKEMTMKEVLLAKKMKLQEALKRKQEAQLSPTNSPKRAKADADLDEKIGLGVSSSDPSTTQLPQTTELSSNRPGVDTSTGEEPIVNQSATAEATRTLSPSPRRLTEEQLDVYKTTSEQSAALNSMLQASDTTPSGFGGAFLDIKPPGSSSTPPTFSFGNSSSIQLPLPSLPVPQNPFAAFNANTSFASSSGNVMVSLPLFGSPNTVVNKKDEEDEKSKDDK